MNNKNEREELTMNKLVSQCTSQTEVKISKINIVDCEFLPAPRV